MKPIVYTAHAAVRLQERELDPSWVERTIRQPQWVEPDPRRSDVERRFSPISELDNRILRVACVETDTQIRVISVLFDRRARRKQ